MESWSCARDICLAGRCSQGRYGLQIILLDPLKWQIWATLQNTLRGMKKTSTSECGVTCTKWQGYHTSHHTDHGDVMLCCSVQPSRPGNCCIVSVLTSSGPRGVDIQPTCRSTRHKGDVCEKAASLRWCACSKKPSCVRDPMVKATLMLGQHATALPR